MIPSKSQNKIERNLLQLATLQGIEKERKELVKNRDIIKGDLNEKVQKS